MCPQGRGEASRRHGELLTLPAEKAQRLEAIGSAKNTLVEMILNYSESQKEMWRKVPWLALQADGRSGWSQHYENAYENGLWTVGPADGGYYHAFVDCATGKLTGFKGKPLHEKYVFMLATQLNELDATAVVERMYKESLKERPSFYTVEDWQRAADRRTAKAIALGVDEMYTRIRKPNWDCYPAAI